VSTRDLVDAERHAEGEAPLRIRGRTLMPEQHQAGIGRSAVEPVMLRIGRVEQR
jgi:hypothetical protein